MCWSVCVYGVCVCVSLCKRIIDRILDEKNSLKTMGADSLSLGSYQIELKAEVFKTPKQYWHVNFTLFSKAAPLTTHYRTGHHFKRPSNN